MRILFYRLKFLALLLVTAMAAACASSPSVRHINNNQTEVRLLAPKDYLLLPVEDGAPNALVAVHAEGMPVKHIRVALSRTRIDYQVPLDLTAYAQRDVTLSIDGCPFDALCWAKLSLSDRFRPLQETRYRPSYHHTPAYGWMNDPNGMVWYDGEYHLFFQHNPYGSRWENLSWGHSVSRDLVHWEQLPNALEPDSLDMIFSGCAVIDERNTAGFGKEAMIALYTAAGARQTQCLAYSLDRGRTFTKYAGNPVLVSDAPDFRDPKIIWHEPTAKWIMILAAGQNMEFYSSANLREWRFESRFGEGYGSHAGVWECPDLFELSVDGDPERKRWVLICSLGTQSGSKVQYFLGDFDGHSFVCDSPADEVKWMDYGRDHYATVTWSNAPDGRRIALGWMNNWQYANDVPTLAFRSANTLPRELSLVREGDAVLLASTPSPEVGTRRGETVRIDPFTVDTEYNIPSLSVHEGGAYGIEMEIEGGSSEIFGFKLFNCSGEYVDCCISWVDNTVTLDRTKSGQTAFNAAFPSVSTAPLYPAQKHRITLYVDRASVEVFVDGGRAVITDQIFPSEPYSRINFYSKGDQCRVEKLEFFKMHQ